MCKLATNDWLFLKSSKAVNLWAFLLWRGSLDVVTFEASPIEIRGFTT